MFNMSSALTLRVQLKATWLQTIC